MTTSQAIEAGKKAFGKDINAPIHDSSFMDVVYKSESHEKRCELMKAWISGWTMKNLAQPLQG